MARETEASQGGKGSVQAADDNKEKMTQPAQPDAGTSGSSKIGAAEASHGASMVDEAAQDSSQSSYSGIDGFAMLRQQHVTLRELLGECANITDPDESDEFMSRLERAWDKHAQAHHVLFDASCRAGLQEYQPLAQTVVENGLVSFLLHSGRRELQGPLALAAANIAAKLVKEIIEREERPQNGILAKAKAAGVDSDALGGRIRARTSSPSGRGGETMSRQRQSAISQEDIMPRNMPERDDQGRFISDDDHRGRGRSSGRYDDDRERDSRGRFMSERHDDYRSSRRYDDDDRDQSRHSGHGGWFGDSRGHAEAAHRGWDHRRNDDDHQYSRGPSANRYDDDDRYSSSGHSSGRQYDDDRNYSSRGGPSSSRYDDDNRQYSGGSSSAGRYDDDRHSSRDRGHGGWFGDHEGHSEASRRGWEHREHDDDRSYRRGRR